MVVSKQHVGGCKRMVLQYASVDKPPRCGMSRLLVIKRCNLLRTSEVCK